MRLNYTEMTPFDDSYSDGKDDVAWDLRARALLLNRFPFILWETFLGIFQSERRLDKIWTHLQLDADIGSSHFSLKVADFES